MTEAHDSPDPRLGSVTPEGAFLAPSMPKHALMVAPWLGSLCSALRTPEIVAAFRAATGVQWEPGTTPLASLIDTATGAQQAFLERCAQWHTTAMWGPLD